MKDKEIRLARIWLRRRCALLDCQLENAQRSQDERRNPSPLSDLTMAESCAFKNYRDYVAEFGGYNDQDN